MVRNHRKLLQIDDGPSILGGRNIADEYFDLNTDFAFVDRDVLVEGPITQYIAESFEAYWNHEFSVEAKVSRERWIDRRQERKTNIALDFITESLEDSKVLQSMKLQASVWKKNKSSGMCNKITMGTSKPGWGPESEPGKHLGDYLYDLMADAPKKKPVGSRILMDSAYLIIDFKFRQVLWDLIGAGTQLDMITNSIHSHDVIVMTPATNMSIRRLGRKGIKFWYFQGERPDGYNIASDYHPKKWASHVKSFIINDDTFMVGSYNFDPRSNHLNGELAIVCEKSPVLTQQLGDYFQTKLDKSVMVDETKEYRHERFNGVNTWGKLKYFLAWPLSQMIKPLL